MPSPFIRRPLPKKTRKGKKQETGNKKTKKLKQCQARAFELLYDSSKVTEETVLQCCKRQKYGLYRGFMVKHTERDEETETQTSHIHAGIYLRDKPADRSFTWGTVLNEHFKVGDCVPMVRLLKSKKRDVDKKLQVYYDYCTDQELHEGQGLGEPLLWKFKPEVKTKSGLNLVKCKTKVYVFHHYKAGKTYREIFDNATEERQAEMMYDFSSIKKMLRNYDLFTTDLSVTHKVSEFKEDAVETIMKEWDPKKESLVLQGPSNMGKTELAKAIAKELTGKKPLFTRNLNKLAFHNPFQPIIFDDMNFKEMGRSKAIAITDVENDSDIRILYGIQTIQAQTLRIFTTNETAEEFMPLYKDEHGAITRRMKVINLEKFGKLY